MNQIGEISFPLPLQQHRALAAGYPSTPATAKIRSNPLNPHHGHGDRPLASRRHGKHRHI